jgi:hypothetical protein
VGLTLVEPLADADVKVPGVMATLAAPAVAQFNVLLAPELMLVGFAPKDVICGREPFPPFAGVDNVAPVHPARAAHTIRAKAVAKQSSRKGMSSLNPTLFPRNELRESMLNFSTLPSKLFYGHLLRADYWSQVQNRSADK